MVYHTTGMIMLYQGLTEHDAFARLRAFAFAQERPIEDTAIDLVSPSIPRNWARRRP
jgi:AmiR/NasT family two-component response regulator